MVSEIKALLILRKIGAINFSFRVVNSPHTQHESYDACEALHDYLTNVLTAFMD